MPPSIEASVYAGAARNSYGGNPVGEQVADLWARQRDMELIAEARAKAAAAGSLAVAGA